MPAPSAAPGAARSRAGVSWVQQRPGGSPGSLPEQVSVPSPAELEVSAGRLSRVVCWVSSVGGPGAARFLGVAVGVGFVAPSPAPPPRSGVGACFSLQNPVVFFSQRRTLGSACLALTPACHLSHPMRAFPSQERRGKLEIVQISFVSVCE